MYVCIYVYVCTYDIHQKTSSEFTALHQKLEPPWTYTQLHPGLTWDALGSYYVTRRLLKYFLSTS